MTGSSSLIPPMQGDCINSYTLLESIGLGGNATVFKAHSSKFGVVAIKILHPGKLTDLDIRRFQREFESMKRLSHPNIIRVYEIGTYNGFPWMSMEFINGGDLSKEIERWNGPQQPQSKYTEIIQITQQLCSALQCLHQQGMVHRDLKPSNVLLTENKVPKIADFGGVKAPHSFETELTVLGALVGTVAFMAPEQILGESIDARTDLYALGAVLFLSLTGRKAFEAQTMAEYLAKHLNQVPQNPCELLPEIPSYLGKICTKLLQKSVQDRYQSAQEVLAMLRSEGHSRYPIGTEDVIEQILNWVDEHHTGIILLHGNQGTGLRECFKHIIADLKSKDIVVKIGFRIPNNLQKSVLICTTDLAEVPANFLSDIQRRLNNGGDTIILINTIDKWRYFTSHLSIPKLALQLKELSHSQIQQLLQSVGILSEANQHLSTKILQRYKGRMEYIQEVISPSWVQHVQSTSVDKIESIDISNSPSCLQNQQVLWQGVPLEYRSLLTLLIIYQRPLSIRMCSLWLECSVDELQQKLPWLTQHQWVLCVENEIEPHLFMHPIRFTEVLYDLLPMDVRILWHQKIAQQLQRKRRFQEDDRREILHHLNILGPSPEATKHQWVLAQAAYQTERWREALTHLEQLNLEWISAQDAELYPYMMESIYFHLKQYERALALNRTLFSAPLTSSEAKTELQLRRFLMENSEKLLQQNDTSIDAQMPHLNLHKPLHQQVYLQRAIQSLYFQEYGLSKTYWENLYTLSQAYFFNPVLEIGYTFLQDMADLSAHFMNNMLNMPELYHSPWHFWYLERLFVSGDWKTLQEHLDNREAFGHQSILEETFSIWLDYIQGNAPRAHERLRNIALQTLSSEKNSDIQLLLHLQRLKLRLKSNVLLPLFSWNQTSITIEEHRLQWRTIKQGIQNIERCPLFWQHDLQLLDAAWHPTTEAQKMQIWSSLSDNCWGIKIQIAKIFADGSPNQDWIEIHKQTKYNCARYMSGDIHAWS